MLSDLYLFIGANDFSNKSCNYYIIHSFRKVMEIFDIISWLVIILIEIYVSIFRAKKIIKRMTDFIKTM